MTETPDQPPFTLQEWDETHPRWPEFVDCLNTTAPEQAPFVLGEYSRLLPCYLLVALQDDEVAGFLRFGVQPIGPEGRWPPLSLRGETLIEAKIHAFAVRETNRGRDIGTALQKLAIRRARELGCYQLASHSGFESHANHHVKLSLGFAAQPELSGENRSIYFLMPLRADPSE